MAKLLELAEYERVAAILSLGYPANPRNGESRSVEEWLGRAKRKPLEEIVRRLLNRPTAATRQPLLHSSVSHISV